MNGIENFNCAVKYICVTLRRILENIPEKIKSETYEIRLRSERPVALFGRYGTVFPKDNGEVSVNCDRTVSASFEDIKDTFNRLCAYSVYSFQRDINSGYVPMENGNRAGICGTAICENKKICSVKDITSINIRISREIKGCADEILERTKDCTGGYMIAGPPSSGKTTIIRDIIRQISSGKNGIFKKTAVIDERREISGTVDGRITNDLGITSDILDSYPKGEGIDIAVRTFSPDVIVCDEISSHEEIEALKRGVNCGVNFIVTVHASTYEELFSRCQIYELLSTMSFEKIFLLESGKNAGKIKNEYSAKEILNEIYSRNNDLGKYCLGFIR